MRAVLNISLPQPLARVVEENVESGRYASKSEFFRSILRMWMEIQLAKDVEESRKELAEGKGRVLRSLKDLR